MAKVLNLDHTVKQLAEEYPEVKEIMASLGFAEITKPAALELMGSVMTIPKGAAVKGISLDTVIKKFEEAGFTVVQGGRQVSETPDRISLLKSYIKRLSDGEDMESVRKDFVENFSRVSVHEIADAEQQLIRDGMPAKEVQKLCDVHSALFHGRTEGEVLKEENRKIREEMGGAGHPIDTLYQENRAIETRIALIRGSVRDREALDDKERTALAGRLFELGRGLKLHYSKKEELIMPVLYQYGITGPSTVMWGVDDEISRETRYLAKAVGMDPNGFKDQKTRIEKVLVRAEEMIYKEEKILFPMAKEHFTDEEWYRIYRDMPEMGYAFLKPEKIDKWDAAEKWITKEKAAEEKAQASLSEGVIHLPTGSVTLSQLFAVLDVIPMDLTFIDENDITRFFTNKGKVFSRPLSCIGRPVYECHPPAIVPVVKNMLQAFKDGKQDHVERWIPNPENPVQVLYLAVHDRDGKYIGTLEAVQSFKDIKIPERH